MQLACTNGTSSYTCDRGVRWQGDTLNNLKDFGNKNGPREDKNLALTGLCVPSSLECGEALLQDPGRGRVDAGYPRGGKRVYEFANTTTSRQRGKSEDT